MDTPFIDIHTHTAASAPDVLQIRCLPFHADIPSEGLFSTAIHPWDFSQNEFSFEQSFRKVEQNTSHPNVVAVGETGIDRLRSDTLPQQEDSLNCHILLSEKIHKPLILHAVHASDNILAHYRADRPSQPWILHGFNGNGQEVAQLTRHGLYLSIGSAVLKDESRIARSLSHIPLELLFLETDTSYVSIKEIYRCVALRRQIPLSVLQEQIHTNFNRCFTL